MTGSGWQHAIFDNEQGRKHTRTHQEGAEKQSSVPSSHSHEHYHDSPKESCQYDHHHHENAEHEAYHHHKDYGLETFVFNARQPFVESRFLKVLRNGLPGVIRAKGFYWTDRVPELVGLLSIAGKMLRTDYLSEWWYTIIQRGDADLNEVPEIVRKSWLPVVGDRRQELVLIGIELNRELIEHAFEDCFVNEQ